MDINPTELKTTLYYFIVLSLLTFSPSQKLGTFHQIDMRFELPDRAFFGQVLKWKKQDSVSIIFFDGVKPSETNDDSYFAVAGLNESGAVWLTGTVKNSAEKSMSQFFSHLFGGQRHIFFAKKINLYRPFADNANKLRLPASVWKKVSTDSEKKKIYRKKLRQLWRNESDALVNSCWSVPLNTQVNSKFGKPRFLPDGRKYFHSGVDLRAKKGTILNAVSDGLVVFAEETIVPGKTVILYHGDGVHTQYMHLSKINVEKGQRVAGHELLGLSGATGRVEGPHLHWEVRWKGRRADPFSFLETIGTPCYQQKI